MKTEHMEQVVEQAGCEAPRCPRCDRLMPEGECNCVYGIKPSPLTGKELVVETNDPDAIKLLRSLRARYAPAHGCFLRPARVRIFEALWEAEAVWVKGLRYRFPDGAVRDIYATTRYLRSLGRGVIA